MKTKGKPMGGRWLSERLRLIKDSILRRSGTAKIVPLPEYLEKWSQRERVLLHVLGLMIGLREKGFIMGGPDPLLTQKGQEALEALIASGFKPSKDELDECMSQCFVWGDPVMGPRCNVTDLPFIA